MLVFDEQAHKVCWFVVVLLFNVLEVLYVKRLRVYGGLLGK